MCRDPICEPLFSCSPYFINDVRIISTESHWFFHQQTKTERKREKKEKWDSWKRTKPLRNMTLFYVYLFILYTIQSLSSLLQFGYYDFCFFLHPTLKSIVVFKHTTTFPLHNSSFFSLLSIKVLIILWHRNR